MDFWHGFMLITSVHLLAAASPGPDFVMVTQQTLIHGKRTGLWCSSGIALGLGVHITYSIFGLAAVISHSLPLLWGIKLLGGSYLIYLSTQGLRSKASSAASVQSPAVLGRCNTCAVAVPSAWRSLGKGFLCNVLNPKAPVYFVSLFTVVLSPNLPSGQLLAYGMWMMLLQLGWFCTVTLLLSQPRMQTVFERNSHWIDRSCGAVMVLLGARVLASFQ